MTTPSGGTGTGIHLSGKPGSLVTDARALAAMAWNLDRRRFIAQIAFLIFGGLIGGFNLLLLIPIVNSVAGSQSPVNVPVFGALDLSQVPLWALLAGFVVLATLQALVMRAASINAASFQPRIVDELRRQAFDAVLSAKWLFILQRRKSDVIAIISVGSSRCGMAVQQMLTASVNVVLFSVTAIVAIAVSPAVAGIALTGVLILGLIQATVVKPVHRLGSQLGERTRNLQAVMHDSLESIRLVRAHDAAGPWAEQLASALVTTRAVQISNATRMATVSAFSSVALAVAASGLVLAAVAFDVSPSMIVVILLLVARMARLAQGLGTTAAQLANSLPAVEDIANLTNEARMMVEAPSIGDGRRGLATNPEAPLLEFDSVTFHYPGTENGVTDISFSVPRGQITVLTGHSGSGKSTTADLALGLLQPQVGVIRVDGEPLQSDEVPWWRSHTAYVPQETVLTPDTLRANLVWSVPGGATDEQCWEALDQAQAHFARALPDGLDTLLGDRGIRLSGGERQRIAIARALLRSPSMLVLDEATSSLDDATELAVLSLVEGLVPAVTVLVIAHRRSTIDAAHNVVEFAGGRVVSEERKVET